MEGDEQRLEAEDIVGVRIMEFSCTDALPGCTVKSTRTLGKIQLTPVEISTAKSQGGMKSKEIRGRQEKIKVMMSRR